MRAIGILLLVFAGQAFAQGTPVVHATWEAVTTESDGTVVDSAEVGYVVYENETGQPLCETQGLSCDIDIAYGQCVKMHMVAKKMTTGLESLPSNVVDACGGDRANFRLSSPTLSATVSTPTPDPIE
jgi:hypothetical protein